MSKKILVKESGIGNFFRSFFQAKADGRESDWLKRLRKAYYIRVADRNPNLNIYLKGWLNRANDITII